jgi:elongation factor P--beta-lysine ligase
MKIVTEPNHLDSYKKYLQVQDATAQYLRDKGYLPIDLPVLSPALVPESYLEVFETKFLYQAQRENLYLTPSPELFLKRLLAYGIGNCFYLGKSFRNADPHATLHSPEFTMLEFYKVKADYMDIADEVMGLLRFIARKRGMEDRILYQGEEISLDHWEKLSVGEAFQKYARIKSDELLSHEALRQKAAEKGYVTEGFTYEDLFSQIYVQEVEPHLGKNGYPTLLYDYPKEFAALAKLNPDRRTAERFEFYIAGIEIGDCYTELVDAKEQEERFQTEWETRRRMGKIQHPIDKGFIEALKYGLIDCAGIAIGFERLAMVFSNVTSINELKLVSIV